jgi:CIC family chloride channel protein
VRPPRLRQAPVADYDQRRDTLSRQIGIATNRFYETGCECVTLSPNWAFPLPSHMGQCVQQSAIPPSVLGTAAGAQPQRRGFFLGALPAPQRLRALVRGEETALVLLAALLGAFAGLLVVGINQASQLAHELLFGLAPGARLSAQTHIVLWRALVVPTAGGLAVGAVGLLLARLMPRRAVDPIEANALYGGKMSMADSLGVVAQTLLSNGAGASVGLEAAYTQIGGAVGSRLGRALKVRRADLRLLVGCGTAGAIAAAFNAPLTGAFYAFELVMGTYSLATLAPVMASAISAVMVQRIILGDEPGYDVPMPASLGTIDLLPVLALGVVCASVGILIMRGVTLTEQIFSTSRVPGWARPAIGGLAVGALALVTPSVLGAGHGALRALLTAQIPLTAVLLLLGLKAAASAISLGSGFRGGLFFASLFLGAMLGKAFAGIMLLVWPVPVFPEPIYGLIGMSGLAVAIVGGPLTMAFLTLEGTGNLPLTMAVVAASVVSSITVRRTFGYSFATWRFHLRGESIRSAIDIGWMRSLTVGRMMRKDVRTMPAGTTLAVFRRDYPLGAAKRVIAVDNADHYAGIVWVDDAHASDEAATVADLLHHKDVTLRPDMTVKEAAHLFETAEADALAVVDPDGVVLGMLTEQHALRRYSEELEKRRRDLSGE